ncbi:PhaM family polyhydroxyalkanoate granule multifunctional regulatory protein [Limnohabitans sp.]|uniref:PhaM family polyhydroxyalkanoate granule multifunctional regulatory protein n=1 Tax=Limnohabitans sp. TaxID=1907725 RepID=UPI0038B7A1D8
MSNPSGFDFTKFVPGFDFLKNLTPGGGSGAHAAPGWVAPTLDPEELDKRIQELKTVHFWLEQNAKAVGATIQALEVQRMTLATLKGMNMSFQDLAESLKVKPQEEAKPEPKYTFTPPEPEPEPQAEAPAPSDQPKAKAKATQAGKNKAPKATAGVDPAHWWGALTDQFQHIATHAMHDMAHRANAHTQAPATAAATPSKPTKPAAKKTSAPRSRPSAARKTAAAKPSAKPKR